MVSAQSILPSDAPTGNTLCCDCGSLDCVRLDSAYSIHASRSRSFGSLECHSAMYNLHEVVGCHKEGLLDGKT